MQTPCLCLSVGQIRFTLGTYKGPVSGIQTHFDVHLQVAFE